MSVDGPGGPDRFGVWRLIDLSTFPAPTLVASRFLNQSANTFNRLASVDDPFAPPLPYDLGTLLSFVPNDVGVPLDLASFGTEVAYIANAPHIGLEAIVPDGMNTDLLAEKQVTGILRGDFDPQTNRDRSFPIRAVDTLPDVDPDRSLVIAVAQQGNDDRLLSIYPQLALPDGTPLVPGDYLLPSGGRPLAVKALKSWPTRRSRDARDLTSTDLAVVMCEGAGACVVPLDAATGEFVPGLLAEGVGSIETPGSSPRGAAADPATQELFVADGTAGLTIIDLQAPGGANVDEVPPDGDDRIVFSLPLNGARAEQVALYRDSAGRRMAAVAAGTKGVFLVQVGPARIEFERLWEADNFANHVVNDSRRCEEEDAKVRSEALFLVPESTALNTAAGCTAGSYCVKLDLDVSPSVTQDVLWSIVDLTATATPESGFPPVEDPGDDVVPPDKINSDGSPTTIGFPQVSNAIECFPREPNPTWVDTFAENHRCAWLAVRFGIDDSPHDGVLQENEWKPYFAIDPSTGKPVRPHVVALSQDRYVSAREWVNFFAEGWGNSAVPLLIGGEIPYLGRNLMRIFRDGSPRRVEKAYEPAGKTSEIEFHYKNDEFSDWLTHKAGADFGPNDESATVVHYTWPVGTTPSYQIGESREILCDAKRIFDNEKAGEHFAANSADSTEIFSSSAPAPSADSCPVPPFVLEFEPGPDGASRDLRVALARVRIEHQIEVDVERDEVGTPHVVRLISSGQVDDLYDFSYAAPGPAPQGAAVQLGFASLRSTGKIYLNSFFFRKVWVGLPPWDDCP